MGFLRLQTILHNKLTKNKFSSVGILEKKDKLYEPLLNVFGFCVTLSKCRITSRTFFPEKYLIKFNVK